MWNSQTFLTPPYRFLMFPCELTEVFGERLMGLKTCTPLIACAAGPSDPIPHVLRIYHRAASSAALPSLSARPPAAVLLKMWLLFQAFQAQPSAYGAKLDPSLRPPLSLTSRFHLFPFSSPGAARHIQTTCCLYIVPETFLHTHFWKCGS